MLYINFSLSPLPCFQKKQLPGSPVVYVLGTYTDMEEDMQERVKKLFSHGVAVAASVRKKYLPIIPNIIIYLF